MLKFLSIRDFVIVDSLELDFASGFTALTGETGAGKSILIDALSLALGERGDAGMVRNGCDRAEISAEFDTSNLPNLQSWLREQELEGDADGCLLRRVLDANGRTRGFINGRSATLQQMREAGEYLLDIHGQHAHQSLLRPDAQRDLLDGYAGLVNEADALALLFRDWQALHRRRVQLEQNAEAVLAERDLLLFQRRELETLNFSAQEWTELQADYARLSHAASLLETAQFGVEVLSEADTACLAQLNMLVGARARGLGVRHGIAGHADHAGKRAKRIAGGGVCATPLPAKAGCRSCAAARAGAAHGGYRGCRAQIPRHPGAVAEAMQGIVARLDELGGDADLGCTGTAGNRRAREIPFRRKKTGNGAQQSRAKIIAGNHCRDADAGHAGRQLCRGVDYRWTKGNAHGLEAVEFQVAANPGTPLRGLAKVASGGELSRISLAIQVAASQVATVPTLIFDEVDSGIGGRVAEIVGALLKQLGRRHQVMCVTHLPQVAAMADAQWQVSKSTRDGATLSTISVLKQAERIEEIARMLGGVKITETTRKHAAEMLGV